MVEHLYVKPDAQRAGIGSTLLDAAKARRPAGLRLWVFQRNEGARAFYAKHGFAEVERTDGAANEEREPDVLLAWPGERG
jgi:ribosomal protein S18 acetylase RimI-like enzyme